jgi:hypothetical protein
VSQVVSREFELEVLTLSQLSRRLPSFRMIFYTINSIFVCMVYIIQQGRTQKSLQRHVENAGVR